MANNQDFSEAFKKIVQGLAERNEKDECPNEIEFDEEAIAKFVQEHNK